MPVPKSISASALQTFEACPARWVAEYINRAANFSSSAADLGTVCHKAMEDWVSEEGHKSGDLPLLQMHYLNAYTEHFEDQSRFDEGWDMLEKWYGRTVWQPNRTVLSTEVKTNFMVKTSAGEIPFNYIWDRCDRIDNEDGTFDIDIIDYKTTMIPMGSPDSLKQKVQARCYGVSGQIAYPEARRIWVTFDLLRYDPIGIVFSREENVATWKYIRAAAERMIALSVDEPDEKINDTCKWCVRKQACKTLLSHDHVGGIAGLSDPIEAAKRRSLASNAASGLSAVIDELDGVILGYAEKEDLLEFDAGDYEVRITARATRTIDPGRAADVLGPDLMVKYGNLTMKSVDAILKNKELDPQQRDALVALIGRKFGEPSVKVISKNPIGD